MANLIRSAKSGSSWTRGDLDAYNIVISSVPPEEFFPDPDPSLGHLDPGILTEYPPGDLNPAVSNFGANYLSYLDLAARATHENYIDDFAASTLKLLDFYERGSTVSMRCSIPLTICGDNTRVAQTDVCLVHTRSSALLVLIEDKTLANKTDAESQVVAEAIAAFQSNNRMRREYALNPLDVMTMPCITMSGTRPTFYLVPVTTELSNAVISGQYPTTPTRVLRCETVAGRTRLRAQAGMVDAAYRRVALKQFLAFKTLARSHWVHILQGV